MSDFNSEHIEETMSEFMELYDLKRLVRVPTCYKIQRTLLASIFFLKAKPFASSALMPLKQD